MNTPLEVLKKYWDYDDFRPPQEDIINSILSNHHTLVLLPTGSGKSLCYQIPALLKKGVCIVISPLIALMQDQVKNLQSRKIKAVSITGSLTQNEIVQIFDNILYGGIKFLYLSPERLQSEFIQQKIRQVQVNLIAVDEAHCISEWGHDFRPSYRKIPILSKIHPQAPVIALTATATKKVFEDIKTNLDIPEALEFKSSLQREEINYHVIKAEDIQYHVYKLLANTTLPSIVYVSSRKSAKNTCNYLLQKGLKAAYYHGGQTFEQKKETYQNWLQENTPIIVATNAFGMGIDKENVATVIHAELPFSIENYMQESGRAGRNGSPSSAYLFYNEASINEYKRKTSNGNVGIAFIKEVYIKLNQYYTISFGERSEKIFQFNIKEFCAHYSLPLTACYNAIDILEKEGILELSENLQSRSLLKFQISHHQLLDYTETHPYFNRLIKTCLRTYSGVLEYPTKIDEEVISSKMKTDVLSVVNGLKELHQNNIIFYSPKYTGNTIQFLVPREDEYTINSIAKNIKQRTLVKKDKVKQLLAYVNTEYQCRTQFLLAYFGEKRTEYCGNCDLCLQKKKHVASDLKEIASTILKLLEVNTLSSKELFMQLHCDEQLMLTSLRLLLEKGKITLTSHNKFQINKHA